MNDIPILSILIFLPIVSGVICLFLPGREGSSWARIVALLASLIALVVAVIALVDFAPGETALRYEEMVEWIPQLGISYHVGADGLNILLIALTAILTPSAIIASWERAGDRANLFMALILFLEGTVIGALVSLDMILYFIFWEAMLIPMYLLISSFGGARRGYAALKFFIYTSVGSLLMLLAIIYISYLHTTNTGAGDLTFDLPALIGTPMTLTTE